MSMAPKFTDIGMGVTLVENDMYSDERGFMAEWYNKEEFSKNGISCEFIQVKTSRSKSGVLRGFHFQYPPYSQGKLIRCLTGEIFFVAVDVRKKSGTFKKYISINLKGDGKAVIFVPKGFASGFLVVSKEDAMVMYYIEGEWAPDKDGGIIWNDPDIGVKWPAMPSIISKRDMELPRMKDIKWE